MEAFKSIFILCIVLMTFTKNECVVSAEEGSKCECGVFKLPTPEKTKDAPLVAKSLQFNFECDANGKESCSNMCIALAGASKEEGPKKICELTGNSQTPYVPIIYYKACNDDVWSYTGFKSTLNVCCENKEVVPCV